MCSSSDEMKKACADYKSIMHPNLPAGVPLVKPGDRSVEPIRVRRERKVEGVLLPAN
jgi:hypothetical protein